MGERACSRCIAITKKGTRCSLNTCAVGPKCWMHTLADENLRVKQSHIKEAGKGLYAQKGFRLNKSNKSNEVVFKKGATIGPYTGKILSAEQVKRLLKSKRTYILQENPNRFIDAVKTNSGATRYANDCRASNKAKGQCKGNNAKFSNAKVKATKNIKNSEEIFVSYGADYWKKSKKKVGKMKK